MKIELKNVKYSAFASHETFCFEATVYIDDKRMGTVWNGGCGESNNYSDVSLETTLNDQAKILMDEKIRCGLDDDYQDADTLISDLMMDWLHKRDIKRICAKKTCFRKPEQTYERDEWTTLNKKFNPDVKRYLTAKYGAEIRILNEEIK